MTIDEYGIKQNNNIIDFHNKRKIFFIINNKLIFPKFHGNHLSWWKSQGYDFNDFESIVRGYVLDGFAYFYKGIRFIVDRDVIRTSKDFIKEIENEIGEKLKVSFSFKNL